jgi:hypothetical protein
MIAVADEVRRFDALYVGEIHGGHRAVAFEGDRRRVRARDR